MMNVERHLRASLASKTDTWRAETPFSPFARHSGERNQRYHILRVRALWQPAAQVTVQVAMQAAMHVASMRQRASLTEQSRDVLQEAMGLANRDLFRKQYLVPLMQAAWLVRTLDPPNHPQQRYRLTPKGQAWLHRFNTLPKP